MERNKGRIYMYNCPEISVSYHTVHVYMVRKTNELINKGGSRGRSRHTSSLNCTHPPSNDCFVTKKLLPVLARKVLIYI